MDPFVITYYELGLPAPGQQVVAALIVTATQSAQVSIHASHNGWVVACSGSPLTSQHTTFRAALRAAHAAAYLYAVDLFGEVD